ncbi:MAG: Arginine/ornithine antiporter ArcD [uncultured Frankineae bacterium]|uniref:Arginine/ornithine antiporter ArcD n=1 Tax=uncultured Frankineae bacterium TaxID=437475 RepID=A0A6J4LM66_9ACTN|nr:MAG: Arginine/ornithine antiporter ArcD [uncultured Frankineae bacterium]
MTEVLAHGGELHPGLSAGAWLAVVLLGAFHGLNPGMGWLFAVSFGLQERDRGALLRALPPIALGHELAVAPVAVAVAVFSSAVTRAVVVGVLAVGLTGFGLYLLLRTRHFTWVGMRLSRWELAWWSFLMSTVTGAGLMLTPVLVSAPSSDTLEQALAGPVEQALAAALVHGLAMLVTSAVVAVVVYEVVGLRVLRSAWVNLDRVWAGAFLVAGVFVWFA